jgi:FO synthase
MNESISRAAGATHGQEAPPVTMENWIARAGRTPRQRTTLYRPAPAERIAASLRAAPLAPVVNTPLHRNKRRAAPDAVSKVDVNG